MIILSKRSFISFTLVTFSIILFYFGDVKHFPSLVDEFKMQFLNLLQIFFINMFY